MSHTTYLANRFREVMIRGTWIANTNYWDQISKIDVTQANWSGTGFNSIADIVRHIHYYVAGIKQVLLGYPLSISDKFSFNFTRLANQEAWTDLLMAFKTDVEEFATLLEQMEEATLDRIFVDEKYGDYRRNMEGMIEHCYYHLGQIVLIRKLLVASGH